MINVTIVKVLEFIFYPFIAFVIGIILMGLFRKIMARIQRRYGPPLLQPLIDIIRFFSQRTVSHGKIFSFGVILALAGSLVVLLFIPFGKICPLCGSGDLLLILYLMLFTPISIALSGGEGANPNISIGVSRKLMLSLGYEVPFLMIILSVMSFYKTTSLVEIIKYQQNYHWAILNFPLVIPGIAYILILPAMMGVRPFDVASAPQEIASGPVVEYGGKFLGLNHIEHAIHMFIGIALFIDLFLGGGPNIGFFLVEMFIVFFIAVFINAMFPRYRVDQAIKYLWRWPSLLAFIGLVLVRIPVKF